MTKRIDLSANAQSLLDQIEGLDTAGRIDALRRMVNTPWPAHMRAEAEVIESIVREWLAPVAAAVAELRDLQAAQRALYTPRMSAGDKRAASPKYAALKAREREICARVGLDTASIRDAVAVL